MAVNTVICALVIMICHQLYRIVETTRMITSNNKVLIEKSETYRELRVAQQVVGSYCLELRNAERKQVPTVIPGETLVFYKDHILKVGQILSTSSTNSEGTVHEEWKTEVSIFRTPRQLAAGFK